MDLLEILVELQTTTWLAMGVPTCENPLWKLVYDFLWPEQPFVAFVSDRRATLPRRRYFLYHERTAIGRR